MRTCSGCGRDIEGDFAFCPHCGAGLPAGPPTREQRKTVTVLFCDVTGSTSLGESVDPEALRGLLARYFERMKAIVERHGGTVEKFIGDAVMAVFGVPVLHEDDALRAVRAAEEMRDALPELGLQARIGLTTGEVVTGTEERLVTGDAVNVAARLEQVAPPGEVLLGGPTLALIGEAADVEPVEPLELKGKAELVPAYRLLHVRETPERRHETLFVGRERELALLTEAWERTNADQSCELVTVVGDAGVGKSRLAAEFLESIQATVVHGRCLPYGEGITYWPVLEVLKQLPVLPEDETAATTIRSLLGESEATTSAEGIAWAFRKTLEQAATKQPLVVVFDDIQWGEDTFRDLIEHVALLSTGATILLVCIARPELSEGHPTWPVTFRLEPLGDNDVEELIPGRIDEELRGRIARAAGGNPLFIGEMLAMAGDADDEIVVPPTLQALLGARLDQLEAGERSVLERGAIEGEVFHRGAVQALAPDEFQTTPHLAALVRKGLITPHKPQIVGDDGFRFRHLLIRDAAYEALPKGTRARLHERFARWLDQHGGALVERGELVGYHLEQSFRYATELGAADTDALEVAAHAADLLTGAGRRALARGDMAAAAGFLRRSAALLEIDPPRRLELLPELGRAFRFAGDAASAAAVLGEALEQAEATGDRRLVLLTRVEHAFLRLYTDPDVETEETIGVAEQALAMFGELADEGALAQAWALIGHANWLLCRGERMEDAFTRALACTRRAGDPREEGWIVRMLALAYCHGPRPVEQAIARCEEILELGRGHAAIEVSTRAKIASLEAMRGRFELARDLYHRCKAVGEEYGVGPVLAALPNYSGPIELLAGDPVAAERELRAGCRALEELGETSVLSTSAALLARTLEQTGQLDEAEEYTLVSERNASRDDLASQTTWRGVRARILARRGEFDRAGQLAREAVEIADRTDFLVWRGEALLDLSEVHRLAGDSASFVRAANDALRLFEAKGHIVLADRTRALLHESAGLRHA